MSLIKKLIHRFLKHFVFFYRYLGYRIFISLALNMGVGILDSFGLLMFLPLLQIVMGSAEQAGEGLGGMSFFVDFFKEVGLPLSLGSVLAIMAIIFGLKAILKFGQMYYDTLVRLYFIRGVRYKMTDRLSSYSYKAFVMADAGRIQNTMSGEVGRVSQAYGAYFNTVQNWVFLIVYFSMALVTNLQFSLLVGIGGILSNAIYRQIYKRTVDNSKKISKGGNAYQKLLIQKVNFFKYLKATAYIQVYSKQLKKSIRFIEGANKKIGFYNAVLSASREPLVFAVIALVIFVQVQFLPGGVSGIIPSLIFFYKALHYVMALQSSWNSFLGASGSLTNLSEFLKDLSDNKETYGSTTFSHFDKAIVARNVEFNYGDTAIIKQVNLEIRKNETVALVGESGSGKTTLVNLLCGLMPIDKGQILIDGIMYSQLDLRTLQRKIGYITQDPVIYSDNIFDNVTHWASRTPETEKRFWEALEKASIAEFVRGLPLKENSLLGNNGIQVSGGQKQRISIARELYKEVEILIMDEATSALDSETEKAIQQNIESLKGKYTIIIVAHRLSTVKHADKVILLSKGRIEDSGTFDELVARSEAFRKMTQLQEI